MKINSRTIATISIFTAFVAAATMAISAYTSTTGGYFNVGEIMVYTTALLMGPVVGGFAGGVGSMLADIALGYVVFAPGTLIIKGVEGFIVGYMGNYVLKTKNKRRINMLSIIVGVTLALIIWLGGTAYFTGNTELTLGIAPYVTIISISIPDIFWVIIAITSFIVITAVTLSLDSQIGWVTLAVLIGGMEMILGYYIYETLVLGQTLAVVEILINIGQVIIGLVVSIPLTRSIRRIMPKK